MIKQEEVYRIGRLGKTHGVKGELSLLFDDDVFDRTDADYLVLDVDGILVPFYIEEYRFKSDTTAIIKFEDVDTQERARELTGCDVWFPRQLADTAGDDGPSLAMLVGYTIVDAATGTTVGRIDDIDDSTANILFCLDGQRLIPVAEELVTDIDRDHQTITMNIPAGLLELQ